MKSYLVTIATDHNLSQNVGGGGGGTRTSAKKKLNPFFLFFFFKNQLLKTLDYVES